MEYSAYHGSALYDPAAEMVPAFEQPAYLPRPAYIPVLFVFPLLLCGVSWLAGGVPQLTDAGFILLTLLCLIFLGIELLRFPRRFGIGGILLFGGVLVWFCHDYMSNWLGRSFEMNRSPFPPETIAKSAFFHCLLVMSMTIGLLLPWGQRLERLLRSLPEPADSNVYFLLVLALCGIGLAAFFFTYDPFYVSLWKAMFAPWVGRVRWTVGRSGNYNYNWGGYVTQLLETGTVSGLFGLFYALLVAKTTVKKAIGIGIWAFWTIYTFTDGRRGNLAKMVLPAVALLFIKYQAHAVHSNRPHSLVGYIAAGFIGFVLLAGVQFEGTFRDRGYTKGDINGINMFASQGNTMFSEGLIGFHLVPDKEPFFGNRIPGEGLLRAMPETFLYFLLHPIPRALWHNKPSDPSMIWYNQIVAGTNGLEGTTISQGLAGHWYIRYGIAGVIEGGLLVGWLMRIVERVLQNAQGRPTTILFALCLGVWLFRTYRNFYFLDLWPMVIGFILFAFLVKMLGMFTGGTR